MFYTFMMPTRDLQSQLYIINYDNKYLSIGAIDLSCASPIELNI